MVAEAALVGSDEPVRGSFGPFGRLPLDGTQAPEDGAPVTGRGRVTRVRFLAAAVLSIVVIGLGLAPAKAAPSTGSATVSVGISPSHGWGPYDCPPPNMSGCESKDVPAGTTITYEVQVLLEAWGDGNPPITGTITFVDNGTPVATVELTSSGLWGDATWSYTPPPGHHGVSARYSGNDHYAAKESGVCMVQVLAPSAPTTLATVAPKAPPTTAAPTTVAPESGGAPTAGQPRARTTTTATTATTATAPADPEATAADDPTSTTSSTSTTERSTTTTGEPADEILITTSSGGSSGVLWVAGGSGGALALAGAAIMRRRRLSIPAVEVLDDTD